MEELRFVIPYDKKEDIPLSEYKNLHKAYWTFIANHLNELKNDLNRIKNLIFISKMANMQ